MSYLEIPNNALPDFTKAVISLWFRVPQESIDACAAAYVADTSSLPPPLLGTIPLVTFGQIFDDAYTPKLEANPDGGTWKSSVVFMVGPCQQEIASTGVEALATGYSIVPDQTFTLAQSYIGVDCTVSPAVLRVNLQSREYAHVGGLFEELVGATAGDKVLFSQASDVFDFDDNLCSALESLPLTFGGGDTYVLKDRPWVTSETFGDVTQQYSNARREWFGGSSPTITVTPDVWHHVLLSFDLSGDVKAAYNTITTECKMWVSFDDQNYKGSDLPSAPIPDGANLGANDIIPASSWVPVVFSDPSPGDIGTSTITTVGVGLVQIDTITRDLPAANYSFSALALPVKDAPMGIPAVGAVSSRILKVDMAEFQMFTDVTLDTSVEANRRAFIGKVKDGSLVPVNPLAVTAPPSDPQLGNARTAIKPQAPAKLLGKQADIAITGSCKYWIGGVNLGSTGQSDSGRFKPTGKIDAFLPSPKIIPKVGA